MLSALAFFPTAVSRGSRLGETGKAGISPAQLVSAPRPHAAHHALTALPRISRSRRSRFASPSGIPPLPTAPPLAQPTLYHPYLPCYGQAVVHHAGGSLSVFSLLGPWGGRHLFYPPQGLLDGRKTAGIPVSVRSTSAPGGLCRRHLRTCPSKCRAPSCIYRIGWIIWPGVLLAPGGI